MTIAIHLEGLQYQAGRGADAFRISNLTLRVPTGSVYGFLGPNGSGKTTTIRLILGILRADAGGGRVLDQPMPRAYRNVLARTGYVPERPHIYPYLSVRQAVELHRAFYPTWDQ